VYVYMCNVCDVYAYTRVEEIRTGPLF
jgi:hypothetical protein